MNELEVIRRVKRELIRRREEIEAMNNWERKSKALKAYAELLTSLEIGTLNASKAPTHHAFVKSPSKQ